MKKTIAVWHDGGLMNADMESFAVGADPSHLAEVALLALQYDMTSIWVMPGSRLSQQVTQSFISDVSEEWDTFASTSKLDEKRPMFARIWRKNTSGKEGRTIYMGFPEYGTWPWKCLDVVTLLATVSYLEQAVGMEMVWSPGYMALSLLKALNAEKRTAWLTPPNVDLLALPINDDKILPLKRAARDLSWKRVLTAKEQRQKYLHKFDKNSAYLAATTGLLVGEGNPEHVSGEAFDERLPGFWRIQVDHTDSPYDGVNLPALFRYDWTTSAMVACARKLGYKVEVLEGYQWSQEGKYHRTLETWAKVLWEVRQELKHPSQKYKHDLGRINAYMTIGAMAHVSIGKLADDKTSGGLYRPDFWALTVGRTSANVFHNIETYRQKGQTPVLVYTDALWFVSNEADPAAAVPGLLDKHDKLGGYKLVYSLPLSKDVKRAFDEIESPTKLTTRLNELAGEESNDA